MTPTKTHLSALVAIPPQELWEPLQAIRRLHDRHVRDWMPHVTLLYPFRPCDAFEEVAGALAGLGAPFEATLGRFRYFRHYEWSHTVWLDPEPAAAWKGLYEGLVTRFPDCHDAARYETGFTPHLSVGQSKTPELADVLQTAWQPLTWPVRELALVARREREPFEVIRTIPL